MSYIPNKDADVFIAFAAEDNVPFPGDDKGWVSVLADYLRTILGQLGITSPVIRTEIPGNLPGEGRLEMFDKSAIVLLVLSKACLECPWNQDERTRSRLFGLAKDNPGRLIVVRKSILDEEPREIAELRHYDFYYREGDEYLTLGQPALLEGHKPAYYKAAAALSRGIADELKRARFPAIGEKPVPNGRASCGKVFLAETPSSLKGQRETVRSHLEQYGIDVVPRGLLPRESSSFEETVRDMLSGCKLFVQLLGDSPGGTTDETSSERTATQLSLALARVGKEFQILQWCHPQLRIDEIQDPVHRERLSRETVRKENLEDFCHAIRLAAQAEPAAIEKRPVLLVDVEPNEIPVAKRIFVDRYAGVRWDLNRPTKKSLRTCLSVVRGVIMFWGEGDSGRIMERYYDFLSRWKTLKKPEDHLLIYDGPPEEKPDFAGGGFQIVAGRHDDDPQAMREFIQRIIKEM